METHIFAVFSETIGMKIAVCDDDLRHAQTTMKSVKSLMTKHNILNLDLNFFQYTDAEQMLLEHDKSTFDVVFLDIDMPTIGGFDVADRMFAKNTDIFIIYTTSYDNFVRQSIKHRVYRFISKGDDEELEDSIIQLFSDLSSQRTYYSFSYKKKSFNIGVSSILYCEQIRNTMMIHTETDVYKQIISIKKILEELPKNFIQCHKSYIVNAKKIMNTSEDKITLRNGVYIPMSKTYIIDVELFLATY